MLAAFYDAAPGISGSLLSSRPLLDSKCSLDITAELFN